MTIYSLYILSKSGGLIYQHDHNIPVVENEKTFSYPLEVKLDVQNRSIIVSYGQRDGIKGTMTIYSLYILSKSGGLIYQHDHNIPVVENEKTFSYPLEVKLDVQNRSIIVSYGQRDGIKVGHTLVAVNGMKVTGQQLDDGRDAMVVLADETNYPINLKFARPKLTTNEKIFQASMFYPLYALACQLSPEQRSSGIEILEADNFRMNCFQTLTGVKFMVISDNKQTGIDGLLHRVYEIYSDYALKNPFYSLEMPIRCELFDEYLKSALEQAEKLGISSI